MNLMAAVENSMWLLFPISLKESHFFNAIGQYSLFFFFFLLQKKTWCHQRWGGYIQKYAVCLSDSTVWNMHSLGRGGNIEMLSCLEPTPEQSKVFYPACQAFFWSQRYFILNLSFFIKFSKNLLLTQWSKARILWYVIINGVSCSLHYQVS